MNSFFLCQKAPSAIRCIKTQALASLHAAGAPSEGSERQKVH